MKFFDRKTCEKLATLGCRSESGFYYTDNHPSQGEIWHEDVFCDAPGVKKIIPAFIEQDFTSTEEYARENCRKLPTLITIQDIDDVTGAPFVRHEEVDSDFHRHEMIDSPDGITYIVKILEGVK